MRHLYVWMRWPDGGQSLAGEIRTAEPDTERGGAIRGEFRYAERYLTGGRAFALDPFALPLQDQPQDAGRPREGVQAIFEDSLPDAWGRALIARLSGIRRPRVPDMLAELGGRCMGALAYSTDPKAPPTDMGAHYDSLGSLAADIETFESGKLVDGNLLSELYRAGSSPGGAKPKVLVHDEGAAYLAKFAARADALDLVRLEAAMLTLAGQAGLRVPGHQVVEAGGREALLIERFDVDGPGRLHQASAQTLLGATDFYYADYSDLADLVRRVSAEPRADLEQLFRQAAFNAAIGNTDDHLKNFAFQRTPGGWRLTPAFDLLPDTQRKRAHVLTFCGNVRPGRRPLLQLGKACGLSPARAGKVLGQVRDAAARFADVCESWGVPARDVDLLAPDVEARLASISPARAEDAPSP